MTFILQLWRYFLVLQKNKDNFRNFKKNEAEKMKNVWFDLETAVYYAQQLSFPEYKVIT